MATTDNKLGATTIVLHWAVAAGIIGMLAFGLFIEAQPSGPDKRDLIQIHKSFGVLVGLLALTRLLWRVREGFPAALPSLATWELRASRVLHRAILVMTIAMPLTGILTSVTYARPVAVFGIEVIPKLLAEKDEALNELASAAHGAIAWLLILAIAVHVLAALRHHVVRGDRTLMRMLGR